MNNHNVIQCLPHDLRQAAHEFQMKTQASLALIIPAMLAGMSTSSQGCIEVKNPTGATTPTDLFVLSIAESGERKSTVDRLVSKPLLDFEAKRDQENQQLQKEHEQKMAVWQVQYRKAKKQFQKAIEDDAPDVETHQQQLEAILDEKPKKIQLCRILSTDATIEALLFGMSGPYPCATLVSSDASNIFSKLNANYLSNVNLLWDGDRVRVDRKTKESFDIEDGRLTLSLMIQPEMLKQLLAKKNGSMRHIGTLARMLVCHPDSTLGKRPFQNHDDNNSAYIEKYYARIAEILKQSSLQQTYGHRLTMEFLPEAKAAWIQFYNHVEEQLSWQGCLRDISDSAAKMANNAARMAALIHFHTYGTEAISLECTNAAIELGYYYLDQFKRLFGEKTVQEQAFEYGNLLYQWLVKNYQYGVYIIAKTVVYNYGPNMLRNKAKLEMALGNLHNAGKIVYFHNAKPACFQLTQDFLLENKLY